MRRLVSPLLIVLTAVCACGPGELPPTQTAPPPTVAGPSATVTFDDVVGFEAAGALIEVPKPANWDSLTTERGVVLAERFGTVAEQGELHGLVAHVFVTPLSEIPDATAENDTANPARTVLEMMIDDPSGAATAATDAVAFTWAGSDAAYYLMSGTGGGPRRVIVCVWLPDAGIALTTVISAPQRLEAEIRSAVPHLLGGLTVNGAQLGAADLQALPDPLAFPD